MGGKKSTGNSHSLGKKHSYQAGANTSGSLVAGASTSKSGGLGSSLGRRRSTKKEGSANFAHGMSDSDMMLMSGTMMRNPDEAIARKNKEQLQQSYGASKKSSGGFKTSRNSVQTSNYKQQRSWFSPTSSGVAYTGVNNSITQNKGQKTQRGLVSALNIIDPNASGRATKKSQVLSPKGAIDKSGNSSLYNQRSQTI